MKHRKDLCVRWRINTRVEWFWNGHWHVVEGEQPTRNLFAAIDSIVSAYPESRSSDFEQRLIATLL